MIFTSKKKLNEQEKTNLQKEFDVLFSNAEGREQLLGELKNIMETCSYEEIYNFSDTYTKWYSLVAWKKMRSLKFEDFLFTLERTLFFGILLGEDVWEILASYLHNKSLDEKDVQMKYEQIQNVVFNSREIIFIRDNDISYRVSDFVIEIKKINSGQDNLLLASVVSNLSDFTKKRLDSLLFDDEKINDYLAVFKSTVDFLIGVDKSTIWYMIDAITYPAQYEDQFGEFLDNQNKNNTQNLEFHNIDKALDEIVEQDLAEQESSSEVEEGENISSQEVIEEVPNIYQEIKTNFEQKYSYDENGELSPIEDVLADLSQLAEEKGTEDIEDLYFFDENSGKFVWNEDLLSK